ncbi:MAG: LamG domain-containing protein [Lentisphaeria bacterium]|nr:LamG domain-containing protein [Lentisphaeria bacterium]
MKKSWLTVFALLLAAGVSGQAKYLTKPLEEKCKAKDLTFLVTFDKAGVNADYAKGEKYSTTMRDTNLGLRGVIGFDGRPAYQPEAGEMLRFPVKGNADPHKGTMILWTAGLDYAPGEAKTDDKSRGNIALAHLMFKKGNRFIEYQLYEYGDNVYFDWRSSDGPQGWGQVGRVGIPRKKIRKGEWHQLAATWDDHRLYCYLNGEKIGETALPRKVEMTADLKTFDKAKSFIGVKSPFYEDKHTRATAVDDFAIYSRPLSALEIRNQYAALVKDGSAAKPQAYALTLNGVDTGHGDKIDRLEVEVDFAALSEADQKKLDAGKLVMEYTLTGPDGKRQEGKWTFAKAQETRILKGVDQTGKYTLETKVGKDTVSASVERPDFSWVGNGYGDDDEVPAIWKDFAVAGRKVTLWNRVYEFGEGPLPETILAYGKPLLKERARLLIDGKEPVWSAGKTARTNRTVTFTGTGKLTTGEIRYATTVEFDGLIKFDWTIAGQPEIGKMELQWTMSPENKQFLMTPRVDETKEQQKEFKYPLSAGGNAKVLWFVSEKKGGFAFSMVNDANWVYDPAKPVFFADKSTGACRVAMITKKVKMPAETPYQALFIATPTRPLPELNRVIQYGDTRGGQKHMTNGGGDGGFKEIFTHEPHPTDFERKYRNAMENSCSIYGAASALTTQSPVARYLRKYWEVPGAYSYNMPYSRPLGNGKYVQERYFSLSACNACRINDYLLAAQHKLYTHKLAGKIWQVYYDLCGDSLCGNRLHGCAYKDKFGREVKSFEVLHKRDLIRRTVAYAHKYGKTVMIHAQRDFVPMMSGLADYYFPGEQYGALLRRNPYGYVDEVSDTIYRSEFNRNVLGVGVIHLPALGQADRANFKPEAFKYTEAMIAMLQSHDVETTQLWAAGKPVQRVWDILARYGVQHKDTVCRLYHEQNEITSSSPDVRVTYYICPEKRYVLFLANKDIRPCTTEIDVSKIAPGSFRAMEEYKEKPVEVKNGKFTIKVPARSFRIVAFPPCSGYPRKDSMTRLWPSWRSKKCDTKFELSKDGGTGGSPCLMQTCGETGGGCFLTHAKLSAGCTYVCKIKVRQKNGKQVSLTVQGRNGARLATVKKPGSEEWQELVLRFTVTGTGKWKNCDEVMITLGGSGPGAVTWFDDFEMEEIPAEGKK